MKYLEARKVYLVTMTCIRFWSKFKTALPGVLKGSVGQTLKNY